MAAYYGSQPPDLTAAYRLLETRRLAREVILRYVSVEFSFTDRAPLELNFTVVIRRDFDAWQFVHAIIHSWVDS